jgi:hypothetical protein
MAKQLTQAHLPLLIRKKTFSMLVHRVLAKANPMSRDGDVYPIFSETMAKLGRGGMVNR